MKDLISILPDIILYVVLEYLYLRTYRTTKILISSDNYEHILVESIVVGFLIYNLLSLIPFTLGYYLDILGMVISSIVIGFFTAKLSDSKIITKLRCLFNLHHTKYKYMWQNISDPDLAIFIDVTNPDTKIRYNGKLVIYEEFERFPIIQLSNYMQWEDNVLINNFSNGETMG